jgi:hypothetical protein
VWVAQTQMSATGPSRRRTAWRTAAATSSLTQSTSATTSASRPEGPASVTQSTCSGSSTPADGPVRAAYPPIGVPSGTGRGTVA